MSVRENLGAKFDQYYADAAESRFFMDRIGDCDRDELLALIGWIRADKQACTNTLRADLKFAWEVARRR